MTIEETLSILKWTLTAAIAVGVPTTGGIIGYLSNQAKKNWELRERVSVAETKMIEAEKNINYLIGVGADLKKQQSEQIVAFAKVTENILTINSNVDKILNKLDKYDENITKFYRDFDLMHKKEL